ncbi:MAG: ComEC/Rec2 family competence protein [Candidatus Nitrospinota bacterium M3_3B_026]
MSLLKSISIALILILAAPASAAEKLSIRFLDAGEGDSILIAAPGGQTALVDTGNLISGHDVTERLIGLGVDKIDHLILTHPHMDHVGGVFHVMRRIETARVYDNGENLSELAASSDFYRWYGGLVRESGRYAVLRAGDFIGMGDVRLKILWPPEKLFSPALNPDSMVILVEYGKFRALLAGDLVTEGEEGLMGTGADLAADVLKVGHHGSIHASSGKFLKAVLPSVAVISVDEGNVRGYPSGEVMERLRGIGAKVHRTGRDGEIFVSAGPDGVMEVKTLRVP